MLNHFTFNGHSTGELGLLVSGINIYGSPSRIVEKVTIPYRSGDLLLDTGAYTNYMLTYTVDIMDNTKATAEAISKWLLGSKGYCELTDTYNPEIYRVASYYNQLDYTLSALYRYGKATITFDCKPQKYLTANQPVSLSSTLSEETSYSLSTPAMPLPLTLEGNTTQKTMSGKNLIPVTATTQTVNGVTFTVNEDGTVRANGTATASFSFNFFYRGSGIANGIPLTAGTTYVLSTADMQYFPINIQIMRNGQPIAVSSNSPFTAQEGDYVSLVWVWRQSGTVFNNALFSPQFEVGSTPTAYEPYCGGIPSPNPDYPQEIHSVKGDNEVRVVGFNLFDKNAMVKGYYISDGDGNQQWDGGSNSTNFIQVIPSQKYYIKSEATAGRWGAWYDIDKNYISGIVGVNTIFTAPSNAHFMRMTVSRPTTGNPDTFCINVSDTEKNGTYEPYKAQVYPINLPVENQISTDYSAFTVGSNYAQYLTIGDTVTLSLTDKDTSVDISGIYVGMLKSLADSTAGYYWAVLNGSVQAKKYTTSQYKYFTIYPKDENTWAKILARFDVQVEVGSVANHYTPYGVAPIELNALGTYNDYFHKTDGKWYLHKETGTADIGSLAWVKGSTSYYTNALATLFKIPLQTEIPKIMSSIGMIPKSANGVSGVAGSNEAYINSMGQLIYYFSMTKYASATEFMNAMKGQTMIYQAKPTETEITDATLISQLNAISKAKTYEGSTTIVQEGTDAQFKLSMPVPTEVTSEYKGEPIITVNEVGTIVWNDSLIKVNSAPVTINSQTLQCYYYSENKNNDVEINEFPKYEQGENYIGSTMDMSVVPNYWKL